MWLFDIIKCDGGLTGVNSCAVRIVNGETIVQWKPRHLNPLTLPFCRPGLIIRKTALKPLEQVRLKHGESGGESGE